MKDMHEIQKGYIEGGYRFFFLEDQKKMKFDYHYHSFHKCLIVLEGKIKYEVEGREYNLGGGDIIWVPSYDAHKVEVSDEVPYKRVVVYLSKEFVTLLSKRLDKAITQMGETRIYSKKLSEIDLDTLSNLFSYKKANQSDPSSVFDKSLNAIIDFINWMNYYFEAIYNIKDTDELLKTNLKGKQEWMMKTMTYIKENLTEELRIDDIAKQVYLSKYYFMRKFKEFLGISIHQYIIQQRLIHSRYLMKKGLSLTDISYQSGFRDYSTFARGFKKTYGLSPREFQSLEVSVVFE